MWFTLKALEEMNPFWPWTLQYNVGSFSFLVQFSAPWWTPQTGCASDWTPDRPRTSGVCHRFAHRKQNFVFVTESVEKVFFCVDFVQQQQLFPVYIMQSDALCSPPWKSSHVFDFLKSLCKMYIIYCKHDCVYFPVLTEILLFIKNFLEKKSKKRKEHPPCELQHFVQCETGSSWDFLNWFALKRKRRKVNSDVRPLGPTHQPTSTSWLVGC